ncbi:hypothetical protein [Janthinobacterium psychrotolerans]|uniref:hypothetical protein n=1 Tax=Janthinobacterium psychrotolerans TaxID=1747903 RepID=UPI000806756F|nr:hypothetical protein [Janthinobacterium psychrotolerans]
MKKTALAFKNMTKALAAFRAARALKISARQEICDILRTDEYITEETLRALEERADSAAKAAREAAKKLAAIKLEADKQKKKKRGKI